MSSVSCEMRARFSGLRYCIVRMLCSRSASLISTTRTSVIIASTILRTFSACCFSLERSLMWAIFVRPSTSRVISSPKYDLSCRDRRACPRQRRAAGRSRR